MWVDFFLFFSKHISGLHTAFWPRDVLLSETAQCLTPSPLASWYQFYCLVNRDTRALETYPKLLVRKLVEWVSGVSNRRPSDPRAETLTTQPTARPLSILCCQQAMINRGEICINLKEEKQIILVLCLFMLILPHSSQRQCPVDVFVYSASRQVSHL